MDIFFYLCICWVYSECVFIIVQRVIYLALFRVRVSSSDQEAHLEVVELVFIRFICFLERYYSISKVSYYFDASYTGGYYIVKLFVF